MEAYNFEMEMPPHISEKSLRREIERRRLKWQTALIAFAGIVAELCLLAAAAFLQPVNKQLSIVFLLYFAVSMVGAGVISVVFAEKRRKKIWHLQ